MLYRGKEKIERCMEDFSLLPRRCVCFAVGLFGMASGGRGRAAPMYEIFCNRGFCLQMGSRGYFLGQSGVLVAASDIESCYTGLTVRPMPLVRKPQAMLPLGLHLQYKPHKSLPAGPVPATSCHPSQMRCQFRPCLC